MQNENMQNDDNDIYIKLQVDKRSDTEKQLKTSRVINDYRDEEVTVNQYVYNSLICS